MGGGFDIGGRGVVLRVGGGEKDTTKRCAVLSSPGLPLRMGLCQTAFVMVGRPNTLISPKGLKPIYIYIYIYRLRAPKPLEALKALKATTLDRPLGHSKFPFFRFKRITFRNILLRGFHGPSQYRYWPRCLCAAEDHSLFDKLYEEPLKSVWQGDAGVRYRGFMG